MRPGKRKKLNPFIEPNFIAERVEKMKASIRAKVEHPFRVLKRQFRSRCAAQWQPSYKPGTLSVDSSLLQLARLRDAV